MYRTVNDFIADWNVAAEGTLRILHSLSDNKLDQDVHTPGAHLFNIHEGK